MARKPNKRNYTRKNPTPPQRIMILEGANEDLQGKIRAQDEIFSMINRQCGNLSEIVDRQHEEIAMLTERNATLVEAVEVLARVSRIEKQQRDLNRFNRSRNDTVLVNECKADYAHGYEKR